MTEDEVVDGKEIENVNRLISIKEIEMVARALLLSQIRPRHPYR